MIMEAANGKKEILLVDDDAAVSKMLQMLLETRGYRVITAASGEEAFKRISPSTDLILLDLALPDQTGLEVCQQFRESEDFDSVPIIMLSGQFLSKNAVEGLYVGADDYLSKPFEYEELIARMEAVMRRGGIRRYSSEKDRTYALFCELKRIIDTESIVPFFQPIFQLKDMKLFGLEGLSRPETQSVLSNPEMLFKTAIQYGCYQDLECVGWKKILTAVSGYLKDLRLFLNCNPFLVEGPKFVIVTSMFQEYNVPAEKIVLEITERSAISDYEVFYSHLCRYRDLGFQFAVDDVGGGYASLESIVETRPEVVKVDKHIIFGISGNPYKQSIVKFIVAFCRENNILTKIGRAHV